MLIPLRNHLDVDIADALKSSADTAPHGFRQWLDRHLSADDPVFSGSRHQDSHRSNISFRALVTSPHKCWDTRCVHYVYGFRDQSARDAHSRIHQGTQGDPASHRGFQSMLSSTSHGSDPHSNITQPLSRQATLSDLPPLSLPSQQSSGDRIDYGSPTFVRPPRRSSTEVDDPQLPPLKRSRLGPPRLESIGKLLRDTNPCLRCRTSKYEVCEII